MADYATSETTESLRGGSQSKHWARNMLDSLDQQSRHILQRYYGNGQSIEEIGAELDIPTLKVFGAIAKAKSLTAIALNRKVSPRIIRRYAA